MGNQSTILIVDDEPVGRETLEGILFPEGYKMVFASNGPEALEKVAKFVPDLVLLDVMMPGMDGFEVCQQLRADPFLAEIPIIMITALDDRDSRLKGIEAGADDFISKPADRVELRARVRTITRLNRYRRLLSERMKFEWVATQADDGYVMVDDNGRILYANPKARLYLGLSADQRTSTNATFQELVKRQYRCEPQAAWAIWSGELIARTPRYLVRPETTATNAFWLQVDIFHAPGGDQTGWIIRLRDVTQELALQHDMRGFHKMVFHKLRTPLIGMLGSQELLTRHASKLSSDDVSELSETALKSMQRLQNQIEDVLQYLEAPSLTKAKAEFNLAQLQSVINQIGASLGLQPIVIQNDDDLDHNWVLLTRRAIELILWEVFENAIKFHPQGTPTVKFSVVRTGDVGICLKIMDDGLTLSPEQLERMWTPYYQGEKHFTGESAGMGLGLSMAASLVWNVGGSCRAYNRDDGPGIVIDLVIPLLDKISPDEPPQEGTPVLSAQAVNLP
jgi:PAS domain S-box-containing protein